MSLVGLLRAHPSHFGAKILISVLLSSINKGGCLFPDLLMIQIKNAFKKDSSNLKCNYQLGLAL
jgi:hypothetical protein